MKFTPSRTPSGPPQNRHFAPDPQSRAILPSQANFRPSPGPGQNPSPEGVLDPKFGVLRGRSGDPEKVLRRAKFGEICEKNLFFTPPGAVFYPSPDRVPKSSISPHKISLVKVDFRPQKHTFLPLRSTFLPLPGPGSPETHFLPSRSTFSGPGPKCRFSPSPEGDFYPSREVRKIDLFFQISRKFADFRTTPKWGPKMTFLGTTEGSDLTLPEGYFSSPGGRSPPTGAN